MSDQRHDEVAALLGVYALDALDVAERALVDEHLATCPRCRAEVREHVEVAAVLGDFGAPAPPGGWDRIAAEISGGVGEDEGLPPLDLAALRRERERDDSGPGRGLSRRGGISRRGRVLAVAAAVVLVAAFGAMGAVIAAQQSRLDDMETAMEGDSMMLDPDAQVVELASADGFPYATAVVGENGRAVLLGTGLAPLPPGRIYQLWAVGTDGPVSLGMLGSDPRIVPFGLTTDDSMTLAITEEPATGSSSPTSDPMATGDLTL